jgi:hypothetical protein
MKGQKNGKSIRLYPVEFRKLSYCNQYKKYDLIEVMVEKKVLSLLDINIG